MTKTTFYTDHWQHIENERVNRYEQMFAWRDGHAALISSLNLHTGSRVLDYGCGPGFVSLGIANIVSPTGRVYGVDLNKQFVRAASERAETIAQASFHLLKNGRIPLADNSVDRVLCKNVLEYVPSVTSTLNEFRRVLEPNGRLLVIDSDWRFVVVEPWGAERTAQFFNAASVAFKTVEIGRILRSELMKVGFQDVEVQIQAGVDTTGGSLSVLRNMASYATEFDTMRGSEVEELLNEAQSAVEAGRYLFSLPQFLVTGINPIE